MVSSEKNKLANAVGAKSARACDNCIKKRARWYCAADDAFLCQSCDSSVHSANPLARRHERVRLKTSSVVKSFVDDDDGQSRKPTWHEGFTRKARTPRNRKQSSNTNPTIGHLVPEIQSEENSHDDDENEEEQLLYRVPIFDPFELCASANSNEVLNNNNNNNNNNIFQNDIYEDNKHDFGPKPDNHFDYQEMNHFLPTEMDLAEFAADVESLLGNGLENESFDMEGLGLLDNCDEEEREKESRVKVEDDEEVGEVINNSNDRLDAEQGDFIDAGREAFVLNFDYDSRGEEDNKGLNHNVVEPVMMVNNNFEGCNDNNNINDEVYDSKKIYLRLDYEGVMSAWDDQKSPWTTGERPDLDAGECWPDCPGACGAFHVYGEMGPMNMHASVMSDGGREARVSRYREKRRTRLFSKKIRYEVRKLNAEKRPRMKGRFVKRSNFVAAPPAFALLK